MNLKNYLQGNVKNCRSLGTLLITRKLAIIYFIHYSRLLLF